MTGATVTVFGAHGVDELPGLSALGKEATLRFAADEAALSAALPDTDILLIRDFRARSLERLWSRAPRLQWVHWGSAGVDTALFPALRDSEVILTNARGVFDQPMAEYVLGLVLCFAKDFPRTVRRQDQGRWDFRFTEPIADRTVLLVGVGSIGRAIGALLQAAAMRVAGVARTARAGDPVFGDVRAFTELDDCLGKADYVINVTPSTPETTGLFSAARFAAMKPGARFINVGRGDAVDEEALAAALRDGTIAGAALDVFNEEPLPGASPLWRLDNVIVSPHMSGDIEGSDDMIISQFVDNFGRYIRGETMINVVDKQKGY